MIAIMLIACSTGIVCLGINGYVMNVLTLWEAAPFTIIGGFFFGAGIKNL